MVFVISAARHQGYVVACNNDDHKCSGIKRRQLLQGTVFSAGLFTLSSTQQAVAVQNSYWKQILENELVIAQVRPVRSKPPPEIPVSVKVQRILDLSKEAREAADSEDYKQALDIYSSIVKEYPDLALTQYSRINAALMLYQLGYPKDAVRTLENLEQDLKGYPELHAALAVILYNGVPDEAERAEQQWEVANEFDKRYANVDWVSRNKHWPPKMIEGLNKFLQLG
eukprot:TRINITY_DN6462_c0_g2_i1.p2 TRINITY_DN6462_c0_g2~~TRINITY_DN6462_c0_g2_i1.p2  ORF type:complete len:237 (-),score=32.04 TRINITY_DN6462_c0_g2_i1:335-1012(-)